MKLLLNLKFLRSQIPEIPAKKTGTRGRVATKLSQHNHLDMGFISAHNTLVVRTNYLGTC